MILHQDFRSARRHFVERLGQRRLTFRREMTSLARGTDGEAGECRKLGGEGLGRRDADLGTGKGAHKAGRLARERAFRHVDHGKRRQPRLLDVAHGFQRVHGLAGLRDEETSALRVQGHVPIAKFRTDIDIDRQSRQLLEPVFRDHAGIRGRAAGHHGHAGERSEVDRQVRELNAVIMGACEGAERIAEHGRLLMDLLVHEMAIIALADQRAGKCRLGDRTLDGIAMHVEDLGAIGTNDRPVAFFQILNAIGQVRQGERIGTDIHFTVAVTDGERAAATRANQEIFVILEQQGERKGTFEAIERRPRCLDRLHATLEIGADQMRHHLGIGLRPELMPLLQELEAQRLEILDDAVMHDGNAAGFVRMGIVFGGGSMGGPAGVADAGGPGKRITFQDGFEIGELAFGASPLDPTVDQGRDAGAVIAAIFEALQRIEQQGRCRLPA